MTETKKKIYRAMIISVVSLTSLIIMFFINTLFYWDSLSMGLNFVNSFYLLTIVCFSLVLIFVSKPKFESFSRQAHVFSVIVFTLILQSLSMELYDIFNYKHMSIALNIDVAFYALISVILFIAFWYFQCGILPATKMINIMTVILWVLGMSYLVISFSNIFSGIFFYIDEYNRVRYPGVIIELALTAITYTVIVLNIVIAKGVTLKTKLSLSSYIVFPGAWNLLRTIMSFFGYKMMFAVTVPTAFYLMSLYLMYFNIIMEEREELLQLKSIEAEQARIIAVQEEEQTKLKTAVMLSQIQPHFLYNTMNSIYYLIGKKPEKAQDAVLKLSQYFRTNMKAVSGVDMVDFSNELEHINTYLQIEKMRFEDDLNIEYDIQTKHFSIPLLSIQPLVENAVRHGICSKEEGGTLKLSTMELEDSYQIIISDNGVGFDKNAEPTDQGLHIGLNNAKARLETMCHAQVDIESAIGEGTTVTVVIPKNGENDQ